MTLLPLHCSSRVYHAEYDDSHSLKCLSSDLTGTHVRLSHPLFKLQHLKVAQGSGSSAGFMQVLLSSHVIEFLHEVSWGSLKEKHLGPHPKLWIELLCFEVTKMKR